MRFPLRALLGLSALWLTASVTAPVSAQVSLVVQPAYSIWDVILGDPVTQIPAMDIVDVSCGTNGGPPSLRLDSVTDFMNCTPEASGLREVYFAYDDEQDYVALAMETEFKVFHGGTSIYAHPVVISVLVDDAAIVRGIRIVTDDRVGTNARRTAVNLINNLEARFGKWGADCADVPLRDGEKPVGRQFVHKVCTGENATAGQRLYMEAYYLRKRGQTGLNLETQQVNEGYFSSGTRFELVELPYEPRTADAVPTLTGQPA